ncbi:MAG TPA: beta-N-acetylglucosaminidase domain-containing protein [Elusimicrobiales bacterium]|nr:beta-N-acetylglucosaminidase domain-containing protein [Elusimicrobiales bacterium]
MNTELGIIEGFYGEPWTHAARLSLINFLKEHGFSFCIYAPKGDPYLRKKWREPMPAARERELAELAGACRRAGVKFGVGLSPYEMYLSPFDAANKELLQARIELFNRVGVDKFCLLMDDMKGDLPGLAERQIEIVNWAASLSTAEQVVFCPTYYSYDPVLEKLFGKMPAGYLEALGRGLDEKVSVFWTGELVCSKSYSAEHLAGVAATLARKPFLWDNYPVNDGPRMCKFLHLRPFTGRPASIGASLAGHAVNPMNQVTLSKISALTLKASYELGPEYDPEKAFLGAAAAVTCADLAARLAADTPVFMDRGLDVLSEAEKTVLKTAYAPFLASEAGESAAAAREVIDWLDGRYTVTRDLFLTQ